MSRWGRIQEMGQRPMTLFVEVLLLGCLAFAISTCVERRSETNRKLLKLSSEVIRACAPASPKERCAELISDDANSAQLDHVRTMLGELEAEHGAHASTHRRGWFSGIFEKGYREIRVDVRFADSTVEPMSFRFRVHSWRLTAAQRGDFDSDLNMSLF